MSLYDRNDCRARGTRPPGQIKRMAVRGEHHVTPSTHFFSALVANSGDYSHWIGDNHAVVTVMLSADDADQTSE